MTPGLILYATDEDLAVRAPADYSFIVPKDQKVAAGSDGRFEPGDRWGLSSASVDFAAAGVGPGSVVLLTQPIGSFRPPGELFAVDSVNGGTVHLRRKGRPAGSGHPPSPPAGLTSVEFLVATFGPQIKVASEDLNRRYGIDELVAGRRPCDLFDPDAVRDVTVLSVLYRQYLDVSRGTEGRVDPFASKALFYKQELDDLIARTVLHWAAGPVPDAPSTRFGTRLSR